MRKQSTLIPLPLHVSVPVFCQHGGALVLDYTRGIDDPRAVGLFMAHIVLIGSITGLSKPVKKVLY